MAEHGRLPMQTKRKDLAYWIGRQRQAKKAMAAGRKCKHGMMTPERASALEAVPGWMWTGQQVAPRAAHVPPRAAAPLAPSPRTQRRAPAPPAARPCPAATRPRGAAPRLLRALPLRSGFAGARDLMERQLSQQS